MKKALITGITGQDGRYLVRLLLKKGYEITGVSTGATDARDLPAEVAYVRGDITDSGFIRELLEKVRPDEIYNLAALVITTKPWDKILDIAEVNSIAPLYILEWIRTASPATRFFQASSSHMFGPVSESPQSETTPFQPQSPYAISKLFVHQMLNRYREEHGLFTVSGILFNHESPERTERFVSRKITSTLARIAGGSAEVLELGNLDSSVDWSFAGDIVEGVWLSLQAEEAEDYVFASGESHTVREFAETAARIFGMPLRWEGRGVEEKGLVENGRTVVQVNPAFMRPNENSPRRGDINKARVNLGWEPKTTFIQLAEMMAKAEK